MASRYGKPELASSLCCETMTLVRSIGKYKLTSPAMQESESKIWCTAPEAKSSRKQVYRNIVGEIRKPQAGIGKTSLTKFIFTKQIFSNLHFRNLNYKKRDEFNPVPHQRPQLI